MGARDERVIDLFFEDDDGHPSPNEEGQVRRVGGDLLAFVGGQVRSLTQSQGDSVIQHVIGSNTNVLAGTTLLGRVTCLNGGIELCVAGEFYLL